MPNLMGHSLGRYQILEQLGEGGMATVYKAYDTRLDRFVAIKVIRTDQFGPTSLDTVMKRFEREAKALAKLSHPNIVHVHDYGEHEGAPYLVMEYLPSGTLKQRPGAPMPWQQALHLLLPIAQALAYAHEHNIIHRDIKPANILLTESGLPMLSDFGIAKILEDSGGATLTGAGMGIGTPEYMAPEQWTGHSGPKSDIYSLGVVLYELVTGRKPYTADTPMAIMLKQVRDPLPLPRQLMPDLPGGLENVLLKALARQTEDRYENMSGFAAALEALAGGQTLTPEAKHDDLLANSTLLAKSEPGREAELATVMASGSKSVPDPIPEIPFPLEEPRRLATRWGLWIPIVVLVVLLCIGAVMGASLLARGLNGKTSPVFTATFTGTSTSASSAISPTQLSIPTQASPQALLPTPLNPPVFPPTPIPTITLPQPPSEIKVMWDTSHGPRASQEGLLYTPDGMYKSLALALTNEKFVISSGDLTKINSYDILVLSAISAANAPYTKSEADEIEQFVRVAGHGLLILSEVPGFGNHTDIVARRFSIGFGELTSDGPVSYSNESFFSGVSSVLFLFGGGIFQVSPPGQTVAMDKGGNSVIAYCECDSGRVMAISDANLWDNRGLSQADNQRFATNVFQWLAKLVP
jgi:serine/threonine protein kinase